MGIEGSGLVDIAREFLLAYRRTREVAALHRSGELSFDVVEGWVGDDDSSALFRLKERCHGLIRYEDEVDGGVERAGLLDLTVGALFHEAMCFRENFYQSEVYGPRVRRLRGATEEETELIREFDRILAGVSDRLDEALEETEALLAQTRRQFKGLLRAHADDGLVARLLVENAGYVALVFEGGLDVLFEEIHGGAAEGYALAARSYLDSGHFSEAAVGLREARARGGEQTVWLRLGAYAAAMEAYRDGLYVEAVSALSRWIDQDPPADERPYAALAVDALAHLSKLVEPEEEAQVLPAAEALVGRLTEFAAEGA